jgi:hypothetical protein
MESVLWNIVSRTETFSTTDRGESSAEISHYIVSDANSELLVRTNGSIRRALLALNKGRA